MPQLTIQKKITVILSVLIFITVLSLGLVINNHARDIVYAEALKNNADALSNVSEYYLHPFIKKLESVTEQWAEDPRVVSATAGPPAELKSLSDAWGGFIAGNDAINSIYYGSADSGRLVSSPVDMDLPDDYDARHRKWYQSAFNAPSVAQWSSVYTDAGEAGKSVITVSRAVLKAGEPVGVVAMDIELARLSDQIKDIDIGNGGYLVILSPDGIVYAHPDRRLLNKRMDTYPWITQALHGDTGSDYFLLANSKYAYSFLTIPETGWKLISIKPVTFQGLLTEIRTWTFGTAMIAALIAILIAQWSSRRILKPMHSMMVIIDDVSSGNMNSRTAIHSRDEFQLLGEQFNAMLDKIGELMRERAEHSNRLLQRNQEIVLQKEEIQALHEETEAMNESLSELLEEIGRNYAVTVRSLANAIEASDSYTRGHCDRVGDYALQLARAMKFSEPDIENLAYASMLHDIGKIGIPGSILNKASSLTDEEFDIVRAHPRIGYEILTDVSFLGECRTILLQHHERIDGRGYPLGLKGEALHPSAKILAIADSFDAMTSARAYRPVPLTTEAALDQLRKGKGTQYDEEMVDAFIGLWKTESHITRCDMAQ